MELDGVAPTLDQIKALALTNYGHFTSMLVVDGRVRGWSLHMQRLARDCRLLFDVELDLEMVRSCVKRAVGDATPTRVVRVTIYDPALDLGTIGSGASPHVLVTTRSASLSTPSPMRLQAASYQREMPTTKHVGLFGAMHRRRAAQRDGFDDVLFLNPDGTISEIATSNIGFAKDDSLIWPKAAYLWGVTMTLLHQARDEPVVMEPLTLSDLTGMDAAFATNAATGVRPVASVDGTHWESSKHPMLKELSEQYADIPGEMI
jgi:branched-subunit amino acid aminotransferase/4-amino-4-deoxychorismate lyase